MWPKIVRAIRSNAGNRAGRNIPHRNHVRRIMAGLNKAAVVSSRSQPAATVKAATNDRLADGRKVTSDVSVHGDWENGANIYAQLILGLFHQ